MKLDIQIEISNCYWYWRENRKRLEKEIAESFLAKSAPVYIMYIVVIYLIQIDTIMQLTEQVL